MRTRSAALLAPLLTSALFVGTAPVADTVLEVDAGRGPVAVHVPDEPDPDLALPLVVLLHGYCGTGAGQEAYFKLAQYVDARGFAFAYPTGTTDLDGCPFWNATDACCNFDDSTVDDVAYVALLLDLVQAAIDVDPARVHLVGHSNGGFMAYRLACDLAGRVASIISLAGATFDDDATHCQPSQPVHVLQIHGTFDPVIAYDGGTIGAHVYPSAAGTVERWLAHGGCQPDADTSAPPLDLDSFVPGDETTVTKYEAGCEPGGSAELWTIVGGTHLPWLTEGFRTGVLDWVDGHPKPVVGAPYCPAEPNSTGRPGRLVAWGSLSVSAGLPLELAATNAPAGALTAFLVSTGPAQTPLGNGTLCVGPAVLALDVQTAPPSGETRLSLTVPQSGVYAGAPVHLQGGFFDAGAATPGFDFTNGLALVLEP